MSRISTQMLQRPALDAILNRQSELARIQKQVSSGKRITAPSDDPVASQQILELKRGLGNLVQFDRNANAAEVRLGLEDNALRSVNDVLQRARELVVAGNNATQSAESRAVIAREVRELRDGLLQLANSQDGGGEYLFGGYSSDVRPFTSDGASVAYHGDQGQRFLQVAAHRTVADGDSGAEVFQLIRNGNGTFHARQDPANTGAGIILPAGVTDPTAYDRDVYTVEFTSATDYEVLDSGGAVVAGGVYSDGDGIGFRGIQITISGEPDAGDRFEVAPSIHRDVFTTLDDIATALETGGEDTASQAHRSNDLNNGLLEIDQGIDRVTAIRTEIGARLNGIDRERAANEAQEIDFRKALSALEDIDLAEAIGQLTLQLAALEAAQRSFTRLQGLSLFDAL